MKPFLQGRKANSMPALSAGSAKPAAPLTGLVHPATAAGGGPSIEAVKEGDKVVRLVITCACGERMEVECLYGSR
jgi:hypothetical protein